MIKDIKVSSFGDICDLIGVSYIDDPITAIVESNNENFILAYYSDNLSYFLDEFEEFITSDILYTIIVAKDRFCRCYYFVKD